MSLPSLRQNATGMIEMPFLPEIAAKHLANQLPTSFELIIDDRAEDAIRFEARRNAEKSQDIIISGVIRRWQGTQSRLEYEGLVDIPPSNKIKQRMIIALLVGIWTIGFWTVFLRDYGAAFSENLLGASTFLVLSLFSWILVTILISWVGSYFLIRDTNSHKRWQTKQEMTKIIQHLHELDNLSVDTSRLENQQPDSFLSESTQKQQDHAQ